MSKDFGGLPADADEQMAVGLRIIENAHRNRVESLLNELKALRSSVEEKTTALTSSQRRNNVLESELIEHKQKQTQLLDENAKLLTTIKRLQKDVTRLEAVRQAVLSSINGEPQDGPVTDIYKSDDYLRSSAPVTMRELQIENDSYNQARLSPARSNVNGHSSNFRAAPNSAAMASGGDDDAREFFKMARSVLTSECFRVFLDHIKRLNAHETTRDETLMAADRLFGDSHPELLGQFKILLDRHSQ
eukprot:GDKJ01022664.1.p1 GENE.GDKJ01022664.1~~GDKJ01022664.1.p1  ORF type:complete len:246 (-),score=53.31 GDKJ01022664.1:119-856(-)